MLSGSFKNIAKQVEQLKAIAMLVIDDKVLNEHGRFDECIIPNEPIKSMCRSMWNAWNYLEKFQSKMNSASYPTKLKAGFLVLKLQKIDSNYANEFLSRYVKLNRVPTLKHIDDIKCNYAYVHVKDKLNESIYFVDKKKGIIEKLNIEPTQLNDILYYIDVEKSVAGKYQSISNAEIEKIATISKYPCPLFPNNTNECLVLYLAALDCMMDLYDAEEEKYNSKLLTPIVDEFRHALPIDWILEFLSGTFSDLPADFTIDKYMDLENEGYIEIETEKDGYIYTDWEGHPSLNQHIGLMVRWLLDMVKLCKLHAKESVENKQSSSSSSGVTLFSAPKTNDEIIEKRKKNVEKWTKWFEDYLEARQKNNNYKAADFLKGKNSDGAKRKNYLDNDLKPAFEKYIKNGDLNLILAAIEKGAEFKAHKSKTENSKTKSLQDILKDLAEDVNRELDELSKNTIKR